MKSVCVQVFKFYSYCTLNMNRTKTSTRSATRPRVHHRSSRLGAAYTTYRYCSGPDLVYNLHCGQSHLCTAFPLQRLLYCTLHKSTVRFTHNSNVKQQYMPVPCREGCAFQKRSERILMYILHIQDASKCSRSNTRLPYLSQSLRERKHYLLLAYYITAASSTSWQSSEERR